MSKCIKIDSDGTPEGTRAFFPDGSRIGGVCSFDFPPMRRDTDALVTLECELITETQIGKCVGISIDIKADGTPSDMKFLAPNGDELRVRSFKIEITARQIPKATIEFYVEGRVPFVGAKIAVAEGLPGTDWRVWRDETTEAIARSGIKGATSIIAVVEHLKREASRPHLGCATTYELLAELLARAEVGGYASYRTVDSD